MKLRLEQTLARLPLRGLRGSSGGARPRSRHGLDPFGDRQGLETAEREYLSRLAPRRAGLQLFNLGLALERAGDQDGAHAVYRRAADLGSLPAMVNLAYGLSRRGEEEEAQDWYRRAVDAGYTPGGVREEVDGE